MPDEEKPVKREWRSTAHLAPYQWKKGKSANPLGRPKIVKDLIPIMAENRRQTILLINQYAHLPIHRLIELSKNPNASAIEGVIARLYSKSIGGSPQHLRILLDRLIGPMKLDLDVEVKKGVSELGQVSTDALKALYIKLKEEAEAIECSTQKQVESLPESSAAPSPPSLPQESPTE